jgi:hypothetical protein
MHCPRKKTRPTAGTSRFVCFEFFVVQLFKHSDRLARQTNIYAPFPPPVVAFLFRDLDSLRARPDFQSLLLDLDFPANPFVP